MINFNLERKQWFAFSLLLILILIIIWQLSLIIFRKPAQSLTSNNTTNKISVNHSNPSIPQKISLEQAYTDSLTRNAINPNEMQVEYIRLFNEYQVAQLQRMIAENNEAIALAKRNAAQAMADTAKLFGNAKANQSSAKDLNKKESSLIGYELIFTTQQHDGDWIATLKKNGQTYDVHVDKKLPDGSKVVSIDEASVLLSKDNGASKELITFSGEMKMSSNQPVVAAPTTAISLEK